MKRKIEFPLLVLVNVVLLTIVFTVPVKAYIDS